MKWFLRLASASAALIACMYRNAHNEKKRQAVVHLAGKADFDPFKMLFISDVHRRTLHRKLFTEPVDLVVIGGDFVERGVPIERIRENLRILRKAAPVYYIFGNNDREVGEKLLRKLFKEEGVKVLDDEAVVLFDNPRLKLVGIDYFAFRENSLSAAFETVQKDDSVIFVCHTPFIFKKVKDNYTASLLLAGHTHGGQIRIGPFGIFDRGVLKSEEGLTELVSNGFGTTTLPLRLGATAEYHVLEIHPTKGDVRLAQSVRIG
ncbi:metallophosphoesterase [Planococcus sp. ISL-109]|uniref:metallophosphoesterase n=1 Tax=Planococcus sp. ISL-109 TaxID=2819166 RepID=UPI001BEC5DE9|nr:metallophosphoesterase [Planococcus sp. ISL-109]MBT2582026.1 metallophosphoesterase [Planococcus sp. ISL-109]